MSGGRVRRSEVAGFGQERRVMKRGGRRRETNFVEQSKCLLNGMSLVTMLTGDEEASHRNPIIIVEQESVLLEEWIKIEHTMRTYKLS